MDLRIGGALLWQNDAEGGLWDKPVPVNSLVLAPAERAECDRRLPALRLADALRDQHHPPEPVSTPAPPR